MIRVRIAEAADQEVLVDFIRDHWSQDHVFVSHPELFAWQHQQSDGRLNMVLAEQIEEDTSVVLGVLGFIPTGRFDPLLGDRDLTLAIWKVREDGAPPGIGLRLLKFLQAELAPRFVAAIGTSEMVRRIYELLRYEVGEMSQAALFNPSRRDSYVIADGVTDDVLAPGSPSETGTVELLDIKETASLEERDVVDEIGGSDIPAKSFEYVAKRFIEHPWYRYEVRLVVHNGSPVAVVVWRLVEAEGSRVLRIVDVIGETGWLGDAQTALQSEVIAADAEYIDIVQWGIEPSVLDAGGFLRPEAHPGLVIPNYFSPFERRNVTIEMAARRFDDGGGTCLFRADSDQDRPNRQVELDTAS